MKQALGFASKILFYMMIGVLLVLNASYTMTFVSELFPNDWIKVWGSLILFDAGAIIWFLVFLTKAEGAGQRGVSVLMGVVDLAGSLIIAGAEVFGAAQAYLSDPSMTNWLRETATYILFIWLGLNIAATWLFHITDPKQQESMKARNIKDQTTAAALDMAEKKVNQVAALLADEISDGIYTNILAELNITNTKLLPTRRENVIDVKAHDAPRYNTQEEKQEESRGRGGRRSANLRTRYAYETKAPAARKATEANVGPESNHEPETILQDEYEDRKRTDPTSRRRE